ncbi:helicase-exonuclease AddAB subunit AddB [Caloranaerobacter azorensis]|uniref:ATP-dependent helicase/deoxyribonuclease subunit B n=1 Tax=Caloranaerobacter azorensis TaxID=116090 RepID=A0A6P1YBT0_9FIRM|nr:helicase-exonuclease AddAB subunit AddB [Caloranaerobacter azorensis]QIB26362.1 helicase-exonuclease AddAB subunit AddB [Caloranaerobacter azorensis]
MELRFILGRASSGKTYQIFKEIKDRILKGTNNKLILLVPEQFTLQTEYDFITKMDMPGIIDLEILSFERLTYKVFSQVGGLKKVEVNELGKIMILRRLFEKYSKDLILYNKASKQDGFISDFCALVKEFKRNEITPDLLKDKIDLFQENNVLNKKLKDITYMYEKFNEFMKHKKYFDEEDKLDLLIENIDKASFLDDAEIWIDGFDVFTSQEYHILKKLLGKVSRLNIALTLDLDDFARDYDVFAPTRKTYEILSKMAEEAKISTTYVGRDLKLTKSPELVYLEDEFFSYPYKKYRDEVSNFKIFKATNPYTEVEYLSSEIISLVRDKGYRWKDIAVVPSSIDEYGMIIKRVFSEYKIPYFIDEKRSILNNPIVKLILTSLDIIIRNFKYEDVFNFIKTGFTNLDRIEYEELENYVLSYGIEGDKWFNDFTYGEEEYDLVFINEIRKKFINPFVKFNEEMKKNRKVSNKTKILFEFLMEINIEEKLEERIQILKEAGELEQVNENTQIWNIIIEVFDQLVEMLGDTTIGIKDYKKILESGFGEYEVGILPPTIDKVLVGNLERSRSHDIKALFLIGVNDGLLPSSYGEEGILTEEDKISLKSASIQINDDVDSRIKEERFSVYKSIAKPTEYLWVSYPIADIEGKALRPSIYIERFKRLFPNIVEFSDITKENEKNIDLISRPESTYKYMIENLRRYLDGDSLDDIWLDVYNWYFNNSEWKDRLSSLIDGLSFDNQESYIGEEKAKALYSMPFKSSISRLEKFVNCPFSHFVNFGLKPKERKEFKIKAPDMGRLFHSSIEIFAKKLKERNILWENLDKEQCDNLVDIVIDELAPEFENKLLQSTYRYRYLVKKLKRISRRAVWTLTEHLKRGEFKPLRYELEFTDRDNSQIPPIIIQLPNGEEIKLEGRIDRVDIYKDSDGNYVKIIDYKSGNKKFSLSDVYYGLQIQLIVYLDAILENKDKLVKNELYPGGVFYFRIDDPLINGEGIEEAEIENEIMKKLKLDGIILKDVKVIKAMDRDIEQNRKSLIIPASLNKNGEIGKRSSALSKEELTALIKHVRNIIAEIAIEILKGNIKIEPCKIGDFTSCKYCQYISICQFDTKFENNSYRNIKKLTNEEVLEKIAEESRGEKDA